MSHPQTITYGLIGFPVKHSFSAAMHNAAFSYLNIAAEYKLFEVKPEELEGFLLKDIPVKDIEGNSYSSQGIAGFNITIPHKVKAKEILEKNFPAQNKILIDPDLYYVKLSGAVNTVKRDNDKLGYWNTDAPGFLKSLEEDLHFITKGKNVMIMGCGGAGRAIIASLSWKNAAINKIYVNDTKEEAISSAKKHFSSLPQWDYLQNIIEFIPTQRVPQVITGCELLVNATPTGMEESDPCPINEGLMRKDLLVYDVIYNPQVTSLLKIAKEKGAKTVNGLGMLLYQGAMAFELWTKHPAPIEVMRKALLGGDK